MYAILHGENNQNRNGLNKHFAVNIYPKGTIVLLLSSQGWYVSVFMAETVEELFLSRSRNTFLP